ncbi:O-antigen ligase family protein [Actinomadura sp. 6N118]|uniref:O-antigen ligase family protein n=1 Tax=Actinomadura sp. 6N118 TaxID=3375151 RepID=UPI0037B7D46E
MQVTVGDLAALVLAVGAALTALKHKRRLPPRGLWVFGPLLVTLTISTLCARDIGASLPGFVRVVEIFLLIPAAIMLTVRRRRDAAVVLGAVVLAGLLQASVGIWQVLTGTGASFAGRNTRAVGTFGAVDIMAMANVVGYALIIVIALALVCSGRRRVLLLSVAAVLVVALMLALSRGSWLAVAAGIAMMLVLRSPALALRVAVGTAAVAIVTLCGLGGHSSALAERAESIVASISTPDRSVGDRFGLWSTAVTVWGDHPLVGVGPKGFPAHRDGYAPLDLSSASETQDPGNGYIRQPLLSPHSQYLLVLSEQGVLGLAGFLVLLGALAWRVIAVRRRTDPAWLISAGFMTTFLMSFLYGDLGGPSCVLAAIMLGLTGAAVLTSPADTGRPSGTHPPRFKRKGNPPRCAVAVGSSDQERRQW